MENKKCTSCGEEALVAFVNETVDEMNVHGMVIRPQERLCIECAVKNGLTLLDNYNNKNNY